MLPICEYLDAVDKDVDHSGGVLVGGDKGGVVLNLVRIKYDDVGIKALAQFTSPINSHVLCRQC